MLGAGDRMRRHAQRDGFEARAREVLAGVGVVVIAVLFKNVGIGLNDDIRRCRIAVVINERAWHGIVRDVVKEGMAGPHGRSARAGGGDRRAAPSEVAMVSVLSAPLVDRPSSDLNIQKKLLLTWSANIAPDAIASPMAMGEMVSESRIGAMIPAAVIAAIWASPTCRP